MPRAAPLDTLEAAYDAAVRMLARKPRSCAEVQKALLDAGADSEHVESVLSRLKAHRHLDDAELASDEAVALLESKGLSPEAAVYKLTSRGIAQAVARPAVDAVREGRSEWALCERALQRRLKGRPLAEKDAGREGRALARLGYEEEIVTRTIERAMNGSRR
jgi:regulatory protein